MTQYVLISLKCQNSEHSKKYQISRRVEQINKWAIYNRPVSYMGPEHFISLGLQLATDQVDLWKKNSMSYVTMIVMYRRVLSGTFP